MNTQRRRRRRSHRFRRSNKKKKTYTSGKKNYSTSQGFFFMSYALRISASVVTLIKMLYIYVVSILFNQR